MLALQNKLPSLMTGSELLIKNQESPPGLKTSFSLLDEALPQGPIPRGALSLWVSPLGYGATSLWLQAARPLVAQKKWCAWISSEKTLFAPSIWNKGVDLRSLYVVRAPVEKPKEWLNLMKDVLESKVFTLIGCEVASLGAIAKSLKHVRRLAENAQVGLVIFSHNTQDLKRAEHFQNVIHVQSQSLKILKCKSRPPFSVPWSYYDTNLLSSFPAKLTQITDRSFSPFYSAAPLSRMRPDLGRRHEESVALQELSRPA